VRILSIDSSTETASCAVVEDNKLLGEINFNNEKQHSVVLMSMIDQLLTGIHLDINSIDGYVVSKGPGSFTGLRIGMSTAKGLAMGSNKPLISVSSLDSLAYNLAYAEGIICPILDALRNNVYTRLFRWKDNNLEALTDYLAISLDELVVLLHKYNEPVYFIGDAIYKHKDYLSKTIQRAFFAPPHLNLTRSSSLGELGLRLLQQGVNEDINISTPIYLRKSQAEREYEEKMRLEKNE
jgi:tRNA threonylcarbamoyladenosine biosynthesis protein TsaB